jgi:hypothetical protein
VRKLLGAAVLSLLLLVAGCGSSLDDETYIELVIDKTNYMIDENLTAQAALEKAAADHQTTPDEVADFEQELANEPDRVAEIAERIMEESTPLLEHYIETYRQALPETAPETVEETTTPDEEG